MVTEVYSIRIGRFFYYIFGIDDTLVHADHVRVVTLAELEALGIEFDKYPNAWLYDPETGGYR